MKGFQWKNNQVTHMHIELTNLCNARCPFCPRYYMSSPVTRPDLELDQITFEQFKTWFSKDFLKGVYRILFCGTHGDPAIAKDLYDICKYIFENAPYCSVMVHTNGGARDAVFWKDMGKLFFKYGKRKYSNSQITFSIDGLQDTNHLYRRNVKWDKLMENVKAYTSTGAKAQWEYLIFKHNEHQIEEAEKFAKKIGFVSFLKKRALGFEKPGGGVVPREVYDKNGVLEYVIEAPTNEELINTTNKEKENVKLNQRINMKNLDEWKVGYNPLVENKLKDFREDIIPTYNVYVKDHDEYEIKCKSCATEEKTAEVYVSANGIVFPCCYVGTRVDSMIDLYEDTQLRYSMRSHGYEKFSLKKYSLNEILNNGNLDDVFTNSWSKKSIEEGKLSYCAMTCGDNSQVDKIYKGLND